MSSARRRATILGIGALIALLVPTAAQAAVYIPSATGSLTPNTYNGSVTKGSTSWEMRADGPLGYARLVRQLSSAWTDGQSHSFGGRFLVNTATGYVSIARADNYRLYGGRGYTFGVARYKGDGLGHLIVGAYSGADQQLVGPAFKLPVGQWFDLTVTMTVGSRISLSINGTPVASGTYRTPAGMERITAIRSGVVATGGAGQIQVRQQSLTVDQ